MTLTDAARRRDRWSVAGTGVGWGIATAVPVLFLAVFFVWPVVALVVKGFAPDGALDLSPFVDVLTKPRTWRLVGLTLAQAVAGTAVSLLVGVPTAYVLYRLRFRGRGVVRAWVTVPFVLPTVVVGVAFRAVLGEGGPLGFLGLDQSFVAIVAALAFFNVAVVVRTVGGMWERLDPRAEQAARTLGAGPLRVLRTVTLPRLVPALTSAASVVFLFCATAFGVVLVLGGRRFGTIETEIYRQTVQLLDLPTAAVLSVLQLVVIVVALAVAARARRHRENALELAAAEQAAHRVARGDLPVVGLVAAFVLLLHVLPIATLVVRSLRVPGGGWGPGNYTALGTRGQRDALTATVWEAGAASLRTALVATLIALVVGGLVSLVLSRSPRARAARRARGLLDGVVMLPLGVSAVTVGFGFLLTMDHPFGVPTDLRTTGLLIPVAQAVVAVPLVVRTLLPVLRAIDPRLRQAAAVLGASPGRVLGTVDWPIAARAAGLAIGFAFAASLGEFGATSFLVRPGSTTLPVVIYQLLGRPGAQNYGMAMAASVVLAVVTASVMLVAERLRGYGTREF